MYTTVVAVGPPKPSQIWLGGDSMSPWMTAGLPSQRVGLGEFLYMEEAFEKSGGWHY